LLGVHSHIEWSSSAKAEASFRIVQLGGRNAKVEYDSANRLNPESFQYGREAREVGTNDLNPFPVRGEVGPTFGHGDRVPVDADESGLRSSVEDAGCVAPPADRAVEDDSPITQSRHEQLDDLLDQDGGVFHMTI
jgi:hypothetical protein